MNVDESGMLGDSVDDRERADRPPRLRRASRRTARACRVSGLHCLLGVEVVEERDARFAGSPESLQFDRSCRYSEDLTEVVSSGRSWQTCSGQVGTAELCEGLDDEFVVLALRETGHGRHADGADALDDDGESAAV
jgi:hypothetical protein